MGACLLAFLLAAEVPGTRPPPKSITVLQLSDHGAGKTLTELLSESTLQEAHKLQGPRVVGTSEVRALLGLEQLKRRAGCDDDSECVAELVGALGTDELLAGSVGRVGERIILMPSRAARARLGSRSACVGEGRWRQRRGAARRDRPHLRAALPRHASQAGRGARCERGSQAGHFSRCGQDAESGFRG
jgi:hypothetical protein